MREIHIYLLILLAAGLSMGYSFRLGIDFYDSPMDVASCTVGVDPTATNGYDLGLDVPAPPPFMMFDAQIIPEDAVFNYHVDIRSDADTLQVWQIQFWNYTAPSIIARWAPSEAPSDSIRKTYIGHGLAPDTTVVWVDMSVEDSLVTPVGYLAFVKFTQDIEPPPLDSVPPVISDWIPNDGDTAVPGSTHVIFTATDETELDTSFGATHLWVNGMDVFLASTRTPVAGGVRVDYAPFTPFGAGSTITAIAEVRDRGTPPNVTTDTIVFTISDSGGTVDTLHTLRVEVMLAPPPMTLSGSKVDIIELSLSDTTNMMGMATFDSLAENTYTVVASRVDYFSAGTTVTMDRDTLILFTLEEDTTGGGGGLTVSGVVSLLGTSDYSGSIVELMDIMGDSTVGTDTTDISGYYTITGIMPGLHKITASHDGYASDSAFLLLFFEDTTVNFELAMSDSGYLLIIDWDNGEELVPFGIGPAEWLYEVFSASAFGAGISLSSQDPDITELDLSGYIAVALVTPTRVGLTSVVDDSSLQALIDYADSGGNIYWEGPDAGTDYGDGSAVGRDFFALFGVDYAAEGFSATTGNIEEIALYVYGEWDTVGYAFQTGADHYIDELTVTTGFQTAYSVGGPAPAVSSTRTVWFDDGPFRRRCISTFYLAAVDSGEVRDNYTHWFLYDLLEMTGITEHHYPEDVSLITVEPNPFNAACKITVSGFGVQVSGIEIYDISGRIVENIPVRVGFPDPGRGDHATMEVIWNPESSLPSGVYLAIIRGTDGNIETGRRLFLVR